MFENIFNLFSIKEAEIKYISDWQIWQNFISGWQNLKRWYYVILRNSVVGSENYSIFLEDYLVEVLCA